MAEAGLQLVDKDLNQPLANQELTPTKREGDRRKGEQRTRNRRIDERRRDWRGQIEFESGWEDKGRRRFEGEQRNATIDRRQSERRSGGGERREDLVERRGSGTPPHHRKTDLYKFRMHRAENGSRSEEGVGKIAIESPPATVERKVDRRSSLKLDPLPPDRKWAEPESPKISIWKRMGNILGKVFDSGG